jgi:hypothetical protein
MPLLNTPNSENQAINTPLSEQKPAKFEKSRLEQRMLPKKFGTQQGRGETSLFPIVALGD